MSSFERICSIEHVRIAYDGPICPLCGLMALLTKHVVEWQEILPHIAPPTVVKPQPKGKQELAKVIPFQKRPKVVSSSGPDAA